MATNNNKTSRFVSHKAFDRWDLHSRCFTTQNLLFVSGIALEDSMKWSLPTFAPRNFSNVGLWDFNAYRICLWTGPVNVKKRGMASSHHFLADIWIILIIMTGWWFGTFFYFIWNNHPNWLSYFGIVWGKRWSEKTCRTSIRSAEFPWISPAVVLW